MEDVKPRISTRQVTEVPCVKSFTTTPRSSSAAIQCCPPDTGVEIEPRPPVPSRDVAGGVERDVRRLQTTLPPDM